MNSPEVNPRRTRWQYFDILEGSRVVAAAASRAGEYVYAQLGPDDGIREAAKHALTRGEIPDDRKRWTDIDTYRALHFGVMRNRDQGPGGSADWDSLAEALSAMVRLLASHLDADTEVTTFVFPDWKIGTRQVSPDHAARAARVRTEEAARLRAIDADRHREDAKRKREVAEAAEATARQARERADVAQQRAERLADSSPFTTKDLFAALEAAYGGPYYLREWGGAIVTAVERLEDEQGHRRVDFPAMDTAKGAAERRYQSISPFEGMLEAPSRIIEVYQRHRESLDELTAARDEVLTALMSDVAALVMTDLDGVQWGDLARYGAVREAPAVPDDYDEWDV